MPSERIEPLNNSVVGYDNEGRQLVVGQRRVPVVDAEIEDLRSPVEFRTRRAIVAFENRWELSIIWGGATYSDNHDWMGPMEGWRDVESQPFIEQPSTVEVGVLVPEPINIGPMMTEEMADALRPLGSFPPELLDSPEARRDRFTRLWGNPLAYVGTNDLLALLDVMPHLPSHPDPALLVDPDFDDVVEFIACVRHRFGIA